MKYTEIQGRTCRERANLRNSTIYIYICTPVISKEGRSMGAIYIYIYYYIIYICLKHLT